ncbi:MAG: transcription antitermination factor NusB [Flavobacteriaceae bacterium]|nr:transcription antitermination factor NusB [Flavobacteriaceae bacterium]
MVNRRHIRIKVMQSVYAMLQSGSDQLDREEKFLKKSIENVYDLYVLVLQLLIEVKKLENQRLEAFKKKRLATKDDKNPNRKLADNELLSILENSTAVATYLEDKDLKKYWYLDEKYVENIWNAIRESELYADYISTKSTSFEEDKQFVIAVFKEIIAPNDTIFEYFEDKNISWTDDIPFVNTFVVKALNSLNKGDVFVLENLYKDEDDERFAVDLFRKTILHHHTYEEYIDGKTPNWDTDRIAEIDMIMIKMAICEFLQFPSIPTRVSINEYIEISKDYSTEKSGYFINGVLDKLSKEFEKEGKLNKIGRGLL